MCLGVLLATIIAAESVIGSQSNFADAVQNLPRWLRLSVAAAAAFLFLMLCFSLISNLRLRGQRRSTRLQLQNLAWENCCVELGSAPESAAHEIATEQAMQRVLAQLGRTLEADHCVLWQFDASTGAALRGAWHRPDLPAPELRGLVDALQSAIPASADALNESGEVSDAAPSESCAKLSPEQQRIYGISHLMWVAVRVEQAELGRLAVLRSRTRKPWSTPQAHQLRWMGARLGAALMRAATGRVLRDSEAYHRTLLEAHPAPMLVFDREGRILDLRARSDADLVMPREQALRRRISEVLPEIAEPANAALQRVFQTGEEQELEYTLGAPADERHFSARLVPLDGQRALAHLRRFQNVVP